MEIQFRQGDVLLRKVEALPAGATPVQNKTVAKGEHSNHHHMLTGDAVQYTTPELSLVVVNTSGKLEHINIRTMQQAEHLPIDLEPGVYEVIHQREYNPYTKLAEQVRD